MRRVFVALSSLCLAAACSTAQEIKRPGGEAEWLISCGASQGWNVCYAKANEVCPQGYQTASQDAGFNRKELRVKCQK